MFELKSPCLQGKLFNNGHLPAHCVIFMTSPPQLKVKGPEHWHAGFCHLAWNWRLTHVKYWPKAAVFSKTLSRTRISSFSASSFRDLQKTNQLSVVHFESVAHWGLTFLVAWGVTRNNETNKSHPASFPKSCGQEVAIRRNPLCPQTGWRGEAATCPAFNYLSSMSIVRPLRKQMQWWTEWVYPPVQRATCRSEDITQLNWTAGDGGQASEP